MTHGKKKVNSEEVIEKLRSSQNPSKTPVLSLWELESMISRAFFFSYKTDENTYNYKLVTDIIYNEKTRLVVKFKDFLIFDDISEFLRRFYSANESQLRIKKLAKFYENYSRIFPNYLAIPESKYLYKNIRKKQKLIDKLNQIEEENKMNHLNLMRNLEEHNKRAKKGRSGEDAEADYSSGKNTIFNTEIKNSILKCEPESISNSALDLVKNKLDFDNCESEGGVENEKNSTLNKEIINTDEDRENMFNRQKTNFWTEDFNKNNLNNIIRSERTNEAFDGKGVKFNFAQISNKIGNVISNNLSKYNKENLNKKNINGNNNNNNNNLKFNIDEIKSKNGLNPEINNIDRINSNNNQIKVSELDKYISDDYSSNRNKHSERAIRITGGLNFFRDLEHTKNFNFDEKYNLKTHNTEGNNLSSTLNLESLQEKDSNRYLNLLTNTHSNNSSKFGFDNSDSFNEIILQMENANNFNYEKDEKLNNCNKNILHEFLKFQQENKAIVPNNNSSKNKNEKENNLNIINNNNNNNKARNNFVHAGDAEKQSNYFLIRNFERERNKIKYFESKQNNQTNYLLINENLRNSSKKLENVFSGIIANLKTFTNSKGSNLKKILYHSFIQSESEKIFKDDLIIKRILCEKYYKNYFNFDLSNSYKSKSDYGFLLSNRINRLFAYVKKMREVNSGSVDKIKDKTIGKKNFNAFGVIGNSNTNDHMNYLNHNINKLFYSSNAHNGLNFLSSDKPPIQKSMSESTAKNTNKNENPNKNLIKKNTKKSENERYSTSENHKGNVMTPNIIGIPNLIIPPNSYVNINNNFYNLYIKQETNGSKINDLYDRKTTPKNANKIPIDFNIKNLEALGNKPLSNRVNRIKDLVSSTEFNKINTYNAKVKNTDKASSNINNGISNNSNNKSEKPNPKSNLNPNNTNNLNNLNLKNQQISNTNLNSVNYKSNFMNKFALKENTNRDNNFNLNLNSNNNNNNNELVSNNNNRDNNGCFSTPRKKENKENNVYEKVLRILQDDSKPKNKNFINYENLRSKASAYKDANNRIKNFYGGESTKDKTNINLLENAKQIKSILNTNTINTNKNDLNIIKRNKGSVEEEEEEEANFNSNSNIQTGRNLVYNPSNNNNKINFISIDNSNSNLKDNNYNIYFDDKNNNTKNIAKLNNDNTKVKNNMLISDESPKLARSQNNPNTNSTNDKNKLSNNEFISTKFQSKIPASQRSEVKSYDFSNIINHEIKRLSQNAGLAAKKPGNGGLFESASPLLRSSNEPTQFLKLHEDQRKKKHFESLLNSSKSIRKKKDFEFNQLMDSYENVNMDLNFTNSVLNGNYCLNTEKSCRDFSDRNNNFSHQLKTLENEREIPSSRRVTQSLNINQTLKFLTARSPADKKKRRILSGYQSITEKLKKIPSNNNNNNNNNPKNNVNYNSNTNQIQNSKGTTKAENPITNASKNTLAFPNKKKHFSNDAQRAKNSAKPSNTKNLSFILSNLNEKIFSGNYQSLHHKNNFSNSNNNNNDYLNNEKEANTHINNSNYKSNPKSNSNQKSFSMNNFDSNKTAIKTISKINPSNHLQKLNNPSSALFNNADSNRNSINKTNTAYSSNNMGSGVNTGFNYKANQANLSNQKQKNSQPARHLKNNLSQLNNSNLNNNNTNNNKNNRNNSNGNNNESSIQRKFLPGKNLSPLYPRTEVKTEKYANSILFANKIYSGKLVNSNSHKREKAHMSRLSAKINKELNENNNINNNTFLTKTTINNINNNSITNIKQLNNNTIKENISTIMAHGNLKNNNNHNNYNNKDENLTKNNNKHNSHSAANNNTNINLSSVISKLQQDKRSEMNVNANNKPTSSGSGYNSILNLTKKLTQTIQTNINNVNNINNFNNNINNNNNNSSNTTYKLQSKASAKALSSGIAAASNYSSLKKFDTSKVKNLIAAYSSNYNHNNNYGNSNPKNFVNLQNNNNNTNNKFNHNLDSINNSLSYLAAHDSNKTPKNDYTSPNNFRNPYAPLQRQNSKKKQFDLNLNLKEPNTEKIENGSRFISIIESNSNINNRKNKNALNSTKNLPNNNLNINNNININNYTGAHNKIGGNNNIIDSNSKLNKNSVNQNLYLNNNNSATTNLNKNENNKINSNDLYNANNDTSKIPKSNYNSNNLPKSITNHANNNINMNSSSAAQKVFSPMHNLNSNSINANLIASNYKNPKLNLQEYTKEKVKNMKEITEKIVSSIKPPGASGAGNNQEIPAASYSQNVNAINSFINLNNRNHNNNNNNNNNIQKNPKSQAQMHAKNSSENLRDNPAYINKLKNLNYNNLLNLNLNNMNNMNNLSNNNNINNTTSNNGKNQQIQNNNSSSVNKHDKAKSAFSPSLAGNDNAKVFNSVQVKAPAAGVNNKINPSILEKFSSKSKYGVGSTPLFPGNK